MLNKNLVMFIAIIAIISFVILPVSAETLNGTLGGTEYKSYTFSATGSNSYPADNFTHMQTNNIQGINGINAVILYGPGASYGIAGLHSGQTPAEFYIGTDKIGSGTFGYQNSPIEYIYVTFDSFDTKNYSGAQVITIKYPAGAMGGQTMTSGQVGSAGAGSPPNGYLMFWEPAIGFIIKGTTATNNFNVITQAQYSFTKPQGLGINGSITKTYPAKAYIISGTSNTVLASDTVFSKNETLFNSPVTSIKIAILSTHNTWYNSSTLFLAQGSYNLTVSPTTGSINDTFTGTISSATGYLTDLKYYSMVDATESDTGQTLLYSGKLYSINFLKNNSGYWNAYNGSYLNEYGTYGGYVDNLGTTIPNNVLFNFQNGGTRRVKATLIDVNDFQYTLYANVTVSGAGRYDVTLYPLDYSNSNFISGGNISVQSYPGRVWTNKTVYSPADCKWTLDLGFYNVFADAPGYQSKYAGAIYVDADLTQQIILYPLETGCILNNTITYIGVRVEPDLLPLQGALVVVSPNGGTQTTSYSGVGIFNLTNGTQYKATATASGYQKTTVTFTPSGCSYSFDIVMGEGGAVPTGATPIITTVQTTVAPTLTLHGYQPNGTFTGFWGPFENMFVSMGADPSTVGLLMTVLLCLALGILGAIVSGPTGYGATGFEAGMVAGFVFSCAFGMISQWFILIAIAWLILRVVIKQYGG